MPYSVAVRPSFGRTPRIHRAHPLIVLAALVVVAFGGCPGPGGPDIGRLPSLTSPDAKAESALREADSLRAQKQNAKAEAAYRRFLSEHPHDPLVPLAQLSLGRLELEAGKPAPARELFDAVATHPDASIAEQGRFLSAVATAQLGEHEKAVRTLEPMLGRTIEPADTTLLLETLADAYFALERYADALAVLDRACRAAPDDGARNRARSRIEPLVRERVSAKEVATLYEDLPRDGCAWPQVVRRAVLDADASGDPERTRELLEVMREASLPIDDTLTRIAMRAERPADAEPNVIGAVLSLSGRGRIVGELALRGLMLAAGLPPKGPLPKGAPQLVFRDDGGDPARAAEAVTELAKVHRAIAIIGPMDVRTATAASQRAQELGVPLLLLTPGGTGAAHGSLVHRMFTTPDIEARALLAHAQSEGASRIAALLPEGAFGDKMAATLSATATSFGLTVQGVQRYPAGSTSFGTQVAALASQPFDTLFIADTPTATASLAPALAAGGLWSTPKGGDAPGQARAIRVIATSTAFDHELARTVNRYLNGAVFAVPFDARTASGDAQRFTEAFQAQFGQTPDAFAAFAHDAYRLVRAAVEAGGTTRPQLAEQLVRVRVAAPASPASRLLPSREPATATQLLQLQVDRFVPIAH